MGTGRRSQSEGFTLIELLIALLISSLLVTGLYSVFYSQNRVYAIEAQVTQLGQNVRSAIDIMSREIRLAGYRAPGSTFNGIATATSTGIRVLADLDQNGNTLGANEDLTYTYNAGTLQIWRNGSSNPIADNITQLAFSYTLKNGTVTSTPAVLSDIRMVKISITGRTSLPDLATGAYRTLTMTSDVTPRNLR